MSKTPKKEDPPKDGDNPGAFVDVDELGFVSAEDSDKKKESQADRLVRYALDQDLRLFVDQFNDPYARFCLRDDLYVTYRLRSRDFKTFLAGLMWKTEEKAPGNEAISSALNVLEAMGREECQLSLYNRIAPDDSGGIWIDMCNDWWGAIHVTATGWTICDSMSVPVLFRRYAHQKPLPDPVRGGDASLLLDFANLKESGDRILYVVTTISYFIPDVPHVLLVLFGPQGSGKSWALIAVRAVVDPSSLELLALPRREREIVQQLNHNYCAFYDNTGPIPTWVSNALCRASTGTGFSKRQLYSDDNDVILQFRRCCGLTDINIAAERGDLLDRSVLLGFEAIPPSERRTDKDLAEDLERKAPVILGGILDILSKAIALYPKVELSEMFRMADYTKWGYCITEAMGLDPQTFIDAYAENVERQSLEAIKASPIAEVLIVFMAGQAEGTWTGTATQLYGFLDETAQAMNISIKQKAWAKTPTLLSRRLNELVPSLPAVGIHITHGFKGKDKVIIINVDPPIPDPVPDPEDPKATVATVGTDAIVTNKKASDLCKDDRAIAIKTILIREGGEISESQLNFELMLEDMDIENLETQLTHLEAYGYIERLPDTVKLGRAWKDEEGDQVE